MALNPSSVPFIQDAMAYGLNGSSAAAELIAAFSSPAVLSKQTMISLDIALSDKFKSQDLQAAILGAQSLSALDLIYMGSAFSSDAAAADVAQNIAANPANMLSPPVSNGMPAGFSAASSRSGQQQTSNLSMPAGSAFSSTGVSPYILLSNGGNANSYFLYFNVLGGSNTAPTVAGATGIAVNILSSDSAIAIANKAAVAFLAANPIGFAASSSAGVLSAVTGVVSLPIASLPGGSYVGSQNVVLSSLTSGVQFYYTVDGSQPNLSSTLYTAPIIVGASETLNVLSILPSGGNSAVTSTSYVISGAGGVATHLVYTTQPSSAAKGVAWSQQPVVTVKDASGATVTSGPDSTALITLSLASGTGALAGTVSMNAVAGVADFSGKGVNATAFGNKVIRATKTDTTPTGTLSFYVDSSILNISNSLATVNLATAANYAILSEAGITNTSGSLVTGNMGVSPIAHTAITGFSLVLDGSGVFSTSSQVTGHVFASDYTSPTPSNLTTAISDMGAAYSDAAGRATPDFTNLGSGEIGGLILTSGLYKWTTGVTISNDVTISGGPNDIFIFQISGTLTMAAAKNVILSGGVVASNIFWQTSGAVTISANAVFNGNVLSATGINLQTNAAANGRLLAGTSVTLQSNAVNQ